MEVVGLDNTLQTLEVVIFCREHKPLVAFPDGAYTTSLPKQNAASRLITGPTKKGTKFAVLVALVFHVSGQV